MLAGAGTAIVLIGRHQHSLGDEFAPVSRRPITRIDRARLGNGHHPRGDERCLARTRNHENGAFDESAFQILDDRGTLQVSLLFRLTQPRSSVPHGRRVRRDEVANLRCGFDEVAEIVSRYELSRPAGRPPIEQNAVGCAGRICECPDERLLRGRPRELLSCQGRGLCGRGTAAAVPVYCASPSLISSPPSVVVTAEATASAVRCCPSSVNRSSS